MKLFRYPKKIKVNKTSKTSESCRKGFLKHSDFAAGIFTLGCCCEYNITLGFELMLEKESPRNLFRLLECRDVDFYTLKGIVMDHACLMDTYTMNRDAKMFEYKKVLVMAVSLSCAICLGS